MKRVYSTLSFCLIFLITKAQIWLPEFSFETGAQLGTGTYAPFLLTSNKYGIYSVNKNQAFARISALKTTLKATDFYYGIDIIDNCSKTNNLYFQQFYGGVKFHSIHLKGGLKEDFYGNQDSLLSIGGTPWSTNARPIPQIYIGIPEFTYVPFTRKFLEIKGGISHGWLGEKDQFVKNAFLHSKYLVGRFGPEKIKLQLGLYHVAQWGGTSPIDSIGKLPSSFKDFLTVFQVEGENTGGPANETIGYLGNHIASYQAAIEVFANSFNYNLYYQTFLDDKNGRVGIDWKNKPDMILGFSLQNNNYNVFFQKVLIEYIHTSHQSGDPKKSGNDNYYNNSIYRSGWTYRNMTIGTPLITSPEYLHGVTSSGRYLINNRVIALNTGITTKVKNNSFMLKGLYSLNYGTISQPTKETTQLSVYSSYSTILKNYYNLIFQFEVGYDNGKLLDNNFGLRCSIKKIF